MRAGDTKGRSISISIGVAPPSPMLMSPLRYPVTRKSPEPHLTARFSAFSDFTAVPFLRFRSLRFVPSRPFPAVDASSGHTVGLAHNREYRFIARSWNCALLSPRARKIREGRLRSLVTERTDYEPSLTYWRTQTQSCGNCRRKRHHQATSPRVVSFDSFRNLTAFV